MRNEKVEVYENKVREALRLLFREGLVEILIYTMRDQHQEDTAIFREHYAARHGKEPNISRWDHPHLLNVDEALVLLREFAELSEDDEETCSGHATADEWADTLGESLERITGLEVIPEN